MNYKSELVNIYVEDQVVTFEDTLALKEFLGTNAPILELISDRGILNIEAPLFESSGLIEVTIKNTGFISCFLDMILGNASISLIDPSGFFLEPNATKDIHLTVTPYSVKPYLASIYFRSQVFDTTLEVPFIISATSQNNCVIPTYPVNTHTEVIPSRGIEFYTNSVEPLSETFFYVYLNDDVVIDRGVFQNTFTGSISFLDGNFTVFIDPVLKYSGSYTIYVYTKTVTNLYGKYSYSFSTKDTDILEWDTDADFSNNIHGNIIPTYNATINNNSLYKKHNTLINASASILDPSSGTSAIFMENGGFSIAVSGVEYSLTTLTTSYTSPVIFSSVFFDASIHISGNIRIQVSIDNGVFVGYDGTISTYFDSTHTEFTSPITGSTIKFKIYMFKSPSFSVYNPVQLYDIVVYTKSFWKASYDLKHSKLLNQIVIDKLYEGGNIGYKSRYKTSTKYSNLSSSSWSTWLSGYTNNTDVIFDLVTNYIICNALEIEVELTSSSRLWTDYFAGYTSSLTSIYSDFGTTIPKTNLIPVFIDSFTS